MSDCERYFKVAIGLWEESRPRIMKVYARDAAIPAFFTGWLAAIAEVLVRQEKQHYQTGILRLHGLN